MGFLFECLCILYNCLKSINFVIWCYYLYSQLHLQVALAHDVGAVALEDAYIILLCYDILGYSIYYRIISCYVIVHYIILDVFIIVYTCIYIYIYTRMYIHTHTPGRRRPSARGEAALEVPFLVVFIKLRVCMLVYVIVPVSVFFRL